MRLLIIEDEKQLVNILKRKFEREGFAVDAAYDGKNGKYLAEINENEYDCIVLDLNIPKIDGISLCRLLRNQGNQTPIIILTAASSLSDKITGLDYGADDYMTKPFSFLELLSRVHALVRRSKKNQFPIMKVGDIELDPFEHKVKIREKVINFTPKEFAVLEFLLRNKNNVVSRSKIIEHVWDYNFDSMSNVVDVIISNIRKKIGDSNNKVIETHHGLGYRISSKH